MGRKELCGGVHTAPTQPCHWVLLKFVGLHVCVGVGVGVGQCERTTISEQVLKPLAFYGQVHTDSTPFVPRSTSRNWRRQFCAQLSFTSVQQCSKSSLHNLFRRSVLSTHLYVFYWVQKEDISHSQKKSDCRLVVSHRACSCCQHFFF